MLRKVVAAIFLSALFTSSAFGYDYDSVRRANYTLYQGVLKPFLPTGWIYGDVVDAPLVNENGMRVPTLVLLSFQAQPPKGKVTVLQKVGDCYVKKWESPETIVAEDGIIGDMDDFRNPADIDKDGLDEIVVTFSASKLATQGLVELRIYRWDGAKGTLISPMSETYPGISEFMGSQIQPPSLFDADNDGFYEVLAQDNSIYKWTDGKYVYWKDQDVTDEPLPGSE